MYRINPIILHDVVYDTQTRKLHSEKEMCDLHVICLPTSATCTSEPPPLANGNLLEVNEPTYMSIYYHYCFAHSYLDFTLPLLSILYEIDAAALANRDYRLFILRDSIYSAKNHASQDEKIAEKEMATYLSKRISISKGTYNGELRHLHQCFSRHPILFEQDSVHRFYKFKTLILGGNVDHQRCIHNHISVYPDRYEGTREASTEQIREWIDIGRRTLGTYLSISSQTEPPPQKKPHTIVIARKESRSLLPPTLTQLEFVLSADERIDFGGIFYMEEMTLRQQIDCFRQADIIISTHGAALTHLIWCKPGTHLIEVFLTHDCRQIIFPYLCKFLGLTSATYVAFPQHLFSSDESFMLVEDFWNSLESLLSEGLPKTL